MKTEKKRSPDERNRHIRSAGIISGDSKETKWLNRTVRILGGGHAAYLHSPIALLLATCTTTDGPSFSFYLINLNGNSYR